MIQKDWVLTRDDSIDNWKLDEFIEQDITGKYHCKKGYWKYCIPYDGNEDLKGKSIIDYTYSDPKGNGIIKAIDKETGKVSLVLYVGISEETGDFKYSVIYNKKLNITPGTLRRDKYKFRGVDEFRDYDTWKLFIHELNISGYIWEKWTKTLIPLKTGIYVTARNIEKPEYQKQAEYIMIYTDRRKNKYNVDFIIQYSTGEAKDDILGLDRNKYILEPVSTYPQTLLEAEMKHNKFLKAGETYYYLTKGDLKIKKTVWTNSRSDKDRQKVKNIFTSILEIKNCKKLILNLL